MMPLAHASEDHSHHHGPAAGQTSVAAPLPVRATNEEAKHTLSTLTPAATPAPTPEELAAAFPDLGGMSMADHMGSRLFWKVMLDRLEIQRHDSETTQAWKGGLWWGGDINRLVVSSEGEREAGALHSETRLYWRHAQSRWWDTTLGLRHDERDGRSRQWLTAGVQGMLPFFIETEVSVFAADDGRSALRVELEYDARLTNRLILQPEIEVDAYGRDDQANGIGRGLASVGMGLRLRYEIRRELAPYIGMEWERTFGDTADLRRAAGEPVGRRALVAGMRLWY
ncbi:MAG: copper resistance protein B [Moraxellaceae bacterium]|nr:copper resistance protein B [Moraxellaceae bacterium]